MNDKILREQILALDPKDYPYIHHQELAEGAIYFRAMITDPDHLNYKEVVDEQLQFTLRHLRYKLELEGGDLFLAELDTGDVYPLKTFYVPGQNGVWVELNHFTKLEGSVN